MEKIDYFEEQLKKSVPITQEMLDKFEGKLYTFGGKYKLGDQLLFAMCKYTNGGVPQTKQFGASALDDLEPLTLVLITLHKDQIDEFEIDESHARSRMIPTVMKI